VVDGPTAARSWRRPREVLEERRATELATIEESIAILEPTFETGTR